MNSDLELLVQFVSGNIEAKDFESKLYSSSTIEAYLENDPDLPSDSYIEGDTYLFLISVDYNSPGGVLNAQGAIEQFLKRKGVDFSSTDEYSEMYDLILEAQPGWLDIDPKYIAEKYLPSIKGLSKKNGIKKLKEYLLEDFKFIKTYPKWIQSPDWPIESGKPLVFLGQIPIEKYFHDYAAAYVFHDSINKNTKTIIQVS